MGVFSSIGRSSARKWRGLGLAAVVLACGACSFLLDRTATQCATDADCNGLGFHPYCVNSVCAASGLGPAPPQGSCVYVAPTQPADFLNQCSTGFLPAPSGGACVSFDDCARLGVCDGGMGPANTTPDPTTSDASAAGAPAPTVTCDSFDTGNGVVYITGSSNFPNVLQNIAPLIIQGVQANIKPGPTPVYLTTNSCTAVRDMFGGGVTLKDPPAGSALSKYAQAFDPMGNAVPCLLGPSGHSLDIGESDVYSSTCDPTLTLAANPGVFEYQGPVQAMVFAVAQASSQFSISREAARQVFGLGGNGGVASPWIHPNHYFVRNKNTGTQQMIGLELGLDPSMFWGVDQGSADNVKAALEGANGSGAVAADAIGIMSVDIYDGDRDNIRALAYREKDQDCAYLPDSALDSKDKQNVRDGHYPIWGPLHFFTANPPPDTRAGDFLGYVVALNRVQKVIDSVTAASLIPACAMAVQRESGVELGPLASLTPTLSCACYFESKTRSASQGPSHGCTTCVADDDCPSNRKCSLGFCELFTPGP